MAITTVQPATLFDGANSFYQTTSSWPHSEALKPTCARLSWDRHRTFASRLATDWKDDPLSTSTERIQLSSTDSDLAVSIVILFGWTGSTLSGLRRYSEAYDDMFPCATQILVLCHPKTFLISFAAQVCILEDPQRAIIALYVDAEAQKTPLLPVAQKIEELLIDGETTHTSGNGGGIVVHAFSNGGCLQMVLLSVLLQTRAACPRVVTPSVVIFDSCPVRYDADMMLRSMSVLLPGPQYAISRVAVKSWYWSGIAWGRLNLLLGTAEEDLLATQWDRLHRLDLFPWINEGTKRLYLYSKSDTITLASVVEEHSEEARQRGFDVYEVVFEDSSHVSHAKSYPDQYWSAVLRIWNNAYAPARHKL